MRVRAPLPRTLGFLLMALTVLAMQAGLGLAFNPRYLDFPFAPLTAAVVPFALVAVMARPQTGIRPAAEAVAAGVLALCAIYIAWNETLANWQSLWFCAALAALALTLARARAAPG
jgi:glucan 1,3-beta-glucosidase